jgi:hypothetical protein
LIFEENGGYIAKVSDFGYSTVDVDDGLINLPFSAPWHHPEQHRNGYTFNLATKMDAYSFGMLCFWAFFRDADDYPDSEMLEQRKRECDMPNVAARLARSMAMYGDHQKKFLTGILGMTLIHNHEVRSDFHAIITYIEEELKPISSQAWNAAILQDQMQVVIHANFQVLYLSNLLISF